MACYPRTYAPRGRVTLLLLHGHPETHVAWLDCGHLLPEERPDETAAELLGFFD